MVPYWVRATGCAGRRDPIFNVPGGGAAGSTLVRSAPLSIAPRGRIVAAAGAPARRRVAPRAGAAGCGGRTLIASRPLYGLPSHPYYHVRPVLHEPGPIATSWLTERVRGPGAARRAPARDRSLYDGERPHTRVMGIWHLYLAPGRGPRAALPALPRGLREQLPAVPGRRVPPAVTVPLTALDRPARRSRSCPAGPMVPGGPRTRVIVGNRPTTSATSRSARRHV